MGRYGLFYVYKTDTESKEPSDYHKPISPMFHTNKSMNQWCKEKNVSLGKRFYTAGSLELMTEEKLVECHKSHWRKDWCRLNLDETSTLRLSLVAIA